PGYTREQRLKEGVAEFVRYWLINPDLARERALVYHEAFERRMQDFPEIWKGMHELRGMYQQFLAQAGPARVDAQIDFDGEVEVVRSPNTHSLGERAYVEMIDDLAPLAWMRNDLTSADPRKPDDNTAAAGPLPVLHKMDAYAAARLNKGNRGMVYG